jgi:hypothetical protein
LLLKIRSNAMKFVNVPPRRTATAAPHRPSEIGRAQKNPRKAGEIAVFQLVLVQSLVAAALSIPLVAGAGAAETSIKPRNSAL